MFSALINIDIDCVWSTCHIFTCKLSQIILEMLRTIDMDLKYSISKSDIEKRSFNKALFQMVLIYFYEIVYFTPWTWKAPIDITKKRNSSKIEFFYWIFTEIVSILWIYKYKNCDDIIQYFFYKLDSCPLQEWNIIEKMFSYNKKLHPLNELM